MKILLIVLGIVVGVPLLGLIAITVQVIREQREDEKIPPAPPVDAPIVDIPPPQVAPDPHGLQSPSADTRQRAASRLAETANPADCDALLAALPGETDWSVRAAIVTGLGKQYYQSKAVRAKGSDRLLGPIIKELDAKERGLRMDAVRALGWIGDKRAARFILPLLRTNDEGLQQRAIGAIGMLGSTEATPTLIEILSAPSDGSFAQKWPRIHACGALANLKDKRAVAPLMKALEDKDATLRGAAARALGDIGDTRASPALRPRLADADIDVRFHALCAVAALRDRDSLPTLRTIARGPRTDVSGQKMNEVAKRAIRFIETGHGKVDIYE